MTEAQHQKIVIDWTQSVRGRYPELKLLFHIGNERYCTPAQGKNLKLAGVKPGVPDLFLPVARGGYHGLFIEMKAEAGRESSEQAWWREELTAEGYFSEVCHGYEAAIRVLKWYLELPHKAVTP